jgi:hypothetical protein
MNHNFPPYSLPDGRLRVSRGQVDEVFCLGLGVADEAGARNPWLERNRTVSRQATQKTISDLLRGASEPPVGSRQDWSPHERWPLVMTISGLVKPIFEGLASAGRLLLFLATARPEPTWSLSDLNHSISHIQAIWTGPFLLLKGPELRGIPSITISTTPSGKWPPALRNCIVAQRPDVVPPARTLKGPVAPVSVSIDLWWSHAKVGALCKLDRHDPAPLFHAEAGRASPRHAGKHGALVAGDCICRGFFRPKPSGTSFPSDVRDHTRTVSVVATLEGPRALRPMNPVAQTRASLSRSRTGLC